jgi:hypothetical protein
MAAAPEGGVVMVVRVATKDVESAKVLVVDLVGLFGGERVSLQADGEVQLQLRGEPNGALVHTLEAVERWLDKTDAASADVCVDERSYTVGRPMREQRSTSSSSNGSSSPRAGLVVNGWDDSGVAGRR